MDKTKVKTFFRKVWHFLWEDDSALSWIVNIILAFVLIKFIVYPGLGLVLGTSHPVVAVVSGSMEHDGSFDDWWDSYAICQNLNCRQRDWYLEKGITREQFEDFHFKNGFNTGDIIVLLGTDPDEVEIGQVIVFWASRQYPIIHRVVEIEQVDGRYIYTTKGDHNANIGPDDLRISQDQLVGKAVFRIPYLGWIKIGVFEFLSKIGILRLA